MSGRCLREWRSGGSRGGPAGPDGGRGCLPRSLNSREGPLHPKGGGNLPAVRSRGGEPGPQLRGAVCPAPPPPATLQKELGPVRGAASKPCTRWPHPCVRCLAPVTPGPQSCFQDPFRTGKVGPLGCESRGPGPAFAQSLFPGKFGKGGAGSEGGPREGEEGGPGDRVAERRGCGRGWYFWVRRCVWGRVRLWGGCG